MKGLTGNEVYAALSEITKKAGQADLEGKNSETGKTIDEASASKKFEQ